MNNLVIVGAGGHGKVIADIAEKVGYTDIVFLDDNPEVVSCGSYKVSGGRSAASLFPNADFVVAIGNAENRRSIQTELLEKGCHIVSLVHPAAVVASSVSMGAGSVVMAGAVVNPGTEIGQGCIVNTCASVDHDCRIGDYVHIAVGAHVVGTVTIGDNTWVGTGAIISNNLKIVGDCVIGAGAVVVKDIEERGTYLGIPAKKLT